MVMDHGLVNGDPADNSEIDALRQKRLRLEEAARLRSLLADHGIALCLYSATKSLTSRSRCRYLSPVRPARRKRRAKVRDADYTIGPKWMILDGRPLDQ